MQLTSLQEVERRHRHIFLSPHLDDVVYSCGGTMGVQVSSGLHPLIINIFAGTPTNNVPYTPLIQHVHQEGGISSSDPISTFIERRRQEELNATGYLEADTLFLDYLDAIYRGSYKSVEEIIGGDVHPADRQIDSQLADQLLELQARLPDAVWYAPLGAGRHVDHQLVCSAADRLVQRGARVYFYEDFPYVVHNPEALNARLQELGGAFEPALVEVSEFVEGRVTAAAMYSSQLVTNFKNEETLKKLVNDYTRSIRPIETIQIERYWTND